MTGSIYSRAVDPGFRVFGVPATYTPPAGAPVACTAIYREPDAAADLGLSSAAAPAPVAEIRAAEVAAPAEGATLAIGARSFAVKNATAADAQRLVWRLTLKEI